jgi:hypothetical protein
MISSEEEESDDDSHNNGDENQPWNIQEEGPSWRERDVNSDFYHLTDL